MHNDGINCLVRIQLLYKLQQMILRAGTQSKKHCKDTELTALEGDGQQYKAAPAWTTSTEPVEKGSLARDSAQQVYQNFQANWEMKRRKYLLTKKESLM